MKKLTLIALVFAIIFSSCSKGHGNDDNFHVNFTLDGVNKSYTGHVVAHRDTTSGFYELTIIGATTATSFDDYMGIYINNDPSHANFALGNYPDNSTTFTVLTTHNKNGIEYEAGQSVAQDAVTYGVSIAHHFKVTITSIDNTTIRGTFSGDYYQGGDVQGTSKLNVTNGDFYAKFQ